MKVIKFFFLNIKNDYFSNIKLLYLNKYIKMDNIFYIINYLYRL